METSLRYGTSEKHLLLHARENFLLDNSFYLQVCLSSLAISSSGAYFSPFFATVSTLCDLSGVVPVRRLSAFGGLGEFSSVVLLVSFCGGEQAMSFAPLPFSFSFLPPGLLIECMPNFSVGPYFLLWSVSENEAKEFACLNLSLCCYKFYFCRQNEVWVYVDLVWGDFNLIRR
jgi:hypothetical protein